jgi:glycosyltransferase involved in cell wall biosynthesis
MTGSCTIVVPCFNEARRLVPMQLDALATAADASILVVDDGSTDDTATVLGKVMASDPGRYRVLSLGENQGKGEAVRRGLLAAISGGADIVAYCDADFATPPAEVARLVDTLRSRRDVDVVIGSRVALMGNDIRRSAFRHFTSRLFATAGTLVLRVPVYDTQCGAKAMRVTPSLRHALATPFVSRWAFDVELLGRLLHHGSGRPSRPAERFLELPLRQWHDRGGPKVTPGFVLQAAVDLARIDRTLRRARRSPGRDDQQRDRA